MDIPTKTSILGLKFHIIKYMHPEELFYFVVKKFKSRVW